LQVRENTKLTATNGITEGDSLPEAIEILNSKVCHPDKSKPRVVQLNNTVITLLAYKIAYKTRTVSVDRHTSAKTSTSGLRARSRNGGLFTVSPVLSCVISVVVGLPAYIALPLDVRELIQMVIEVVAWANTALPL
jgi:hypothetical protein